MNNVGEGDPAFGDVIGTCCVCTLQAVMWCDVESAEKSLRIVESTCCCMTLWQERPGHTNPTMYQHYIRWYSTSRARTGWWSDDWWSM